MSCRLTVAYGLSYRQREKKKEEDEEEEEKEEKKENIVIEKGFSPFFSRSHLLTRPLCFFDNHEQAMVPLLLLLLRDVVERRSIKQ
jgi:hypothetical protein